MALFFTRHCLASAAVFVARTAWLAVAFVVFVYHSASPPYRVLLYALPAACTVR